jgi:hypothetical protein
LWDHHLRVSLHIGTTGSHVPHKSLNHVHAAFTPAATQAISRLLLGSSWVNDCTQFRRHPYAFDASSNGSLALVSVALT